MEKMVHFSNILTFMEKKVRSVQELTANIELLNHLSLIEQLFFALIAKNNKVDPFNLPIYTI